MICELGLNRAIPQSFVLELNICIKQRVHERVSF